MKRNSLSSSIAVIFIGVVFFLLLRTAVVQAAGGPSPCISDPVSFGGLEKRLLPLAAECKNATGYDYCGRGEQTTGEYAPSPGCATPTSIVLHTTHGDLTTDDLYNYFANGSGNRHVGSHFGIGQDGKIIQMVEMGKSQVEYAQAVGGIKDHISIEMGAPGNYANKSEAPAAQYESALKLVKTLMQTYNIPLSGVKGHFDYWPISSGGAGDPGAGWMTDFKKDLPDAPALDGGSSTNPGGGESRTSSSCAITAVGNPDPATKPVCAVTDEGGGIPAGNFVYYCQFDSRWGDTCDMTNSGCGPTALAMVLATFGVNITPPEVDVFFRDQGARSCGGPSDVSMILKTSWFTGHGLESVKDIASNNQVDLSVAKGFLDQGDLIIFNVNNYPCKGCQDRFSPVGHYFVVDEVDVAGNRIHTRDPNNCFGDGGQENPDASLAWTDLDNPINEGGGKGAEFWNAWVIRKVK